jgi:hypothetical protein
MNLSDYITDKIKSHFIENSIYILDCDINMIYNRVIGGEYAFQIIYNDSIATLINNVYYRSAFKLVKPLNDSLLVFSPPIEINSHDLIDACWVYMNQYKPTYSEREILFFDRNEIREIKLKFELNI